MAVDGRLNFDTKIDTKGFSKGVNSLGAQMNSLIGLAGKLAVALGAAFSVKEIIESAAEVKAAQSQFEQTFGEIQSQAESMINGVAKSSRILETRLKGVGTSIYAFAKTTGMDSASALNLMNDALQVTADSAAYYDRSLEDTAESLKSFLKGNFENDAALGLSCTETTRNAAANKLYGKSFMQLSEAQKQMTLLQMVKDANALSGAMGQAAREADGWENVTGNLKEAWKQLLAAVGQPALALAVPVVQNITATVQKLTEVAKSASSALLELFNIKFDNTSEKVADSASDAADNYASIADSAEETAKQQENQLASFDKINKLPDKSDDGAASAGSAAGAVNGIAITAETSQAEREISDFSKNVKKIFGKLKTWITKNFGGSFKGIWNGFKEETDEFKRTLLGIWSDLGTLSEPLREYFENDLTPYLRTSVQTAGTILNGLFDSFNMVFSDIWRIAVFPILQNFITDGLPLITQFKTEVDKTLGTMFLGVKELFDMFWTEVISPALDFVVTLWTDSVTMLYDAWKKWGAPIFEEFREFITNAKDTLKEYWEKFLFPIFDTIISKAGELWEDHLKPMIWELLDTVGELVDGILTFWNDKIFPVIRWLIDKLGPLLSKAVSKIVTMIFERVGKIVDTVKSVLTTLNGVISFIKGVFSGDWEKAWTGILTIFKGIWEGLEVWFKKPINAIISLINKMTSAVADGLNYVIDGINSMSFDIPDWVPEIGGSTFGFNLSYVDIPEIPKLATGTVVPANYGQFLAVLGDNKREAEIVSPLSTMKQAVLEALVAYGGTGGNGQKMSLTIPITINGRVISQIVIDDINEYIRRNGRSPIKA